MVVQDAFCALRVERRLGLLNGERLLKGGGIAERCEKKGYTLLSRNLGQQALFARCSSINMIMKRE